MWRKCWAEAGLVPLLRELVWALVVCWKGLILTCRQRPWGASHMPALGSMTYTPGRRTKQAGVDGSGASSLAVCCSSQGMGSVTPGPCSPLLELRWAGWVWVGEGYWRYMQGGFPVVNVALLELFKTPLALGLFLCGPCTHVHSFAAPSIAAGTSGG